MSTAYAKLPIGATVIDSPTNNKEQATLETTRVLFFAHDTITDREKRELPFKEFGGMYLPHIATLRDTKHMLYRCMLTQLPPFKMIGDWDMMLPPEARQEGGRWVRSFTQTTVDATGQAKNTTVNGFLGSSITEEGEFKNTRSNHLIFTKRYPLHEARFATRRSGTHTPGGVVDIEALLNATKEEIMEAQYFFFPNWDEVIRGEAQLPSTTRGLQDHLKSRIDAIADLPWSGEKKAKYYAIGRDMLRSSTEYERTVKEAVRQDEIVSKSAFAQGDTGATHSVISEQYLEQTGTRRKEDMLSGENSAVSELTREMREERAEKAKADAIRVQLEERKQYVAEVQGGFRERDLDEEVRLGMRKAETAPQRAIKSVTIPTEAVNVGGNSFKMEVPTDAEVKAAIADGTAEVEYHGVAAQEQTTDATITELAPISVHDEVTVDGRTATVIAKPFGRFKVKFADDGSEQMVDRGQIG